MLSKILRTTVKGISALPRVLAKLINPKTGEVAVSVYSLGTALGYSGKNIDFIYKQFILETAAGKSVAFRQDLNAFGMNEVNVRETTQIGARRVSPNEVLGQYASVWASCVDYFLWADYWGLDAFKRSTDFPERVGDIYHVNPDYTASVASTTAVGLTAGKAITWLVLPLEFLAIQKIWNFFKS